MFKAARILFINTETPLHAGTGQALGAVDLPIQRERITDYPIIQASSIKGKLRAETDPGENGKGWLKKEEFIAIFGPEGDNAAEHAGALSVGDATLLFFPVRSLAGVFAWVSSVDLLARFRRQAAVAGVPVSWDLPPEPGSGEALIYGDLLVAGDKVVLEEFSFEPKKEESLKSIGDWFAANAFLQSEEYNYWRNSLPFRFCLLHGDALRDFVRYSTEVQTHICLDPETKTVKTGALWTTESLPADTLLYSTLMATQSRTKKVNLTGEEILQKVAQLITNGLSRIQLGGNETTGQGIVALRITGGEKLQ